MSRKRSRIISISQEFIEFKDPPFSPYILIRTESIRPTSIAMAAAGGGSLKYIPLPAIFTAADLSEVQEIVRKHYAKQKAVPLFGKIMGYFVAFSETGGVTLGLDGNEVENGRKQGRFWPQSISIQDRI